MSEVLRCNNMSVSLIIEPRNSKKYQLANYVFQKSSSLLCMGQSLKLYFPQHCFPCCQEQTRKLLHDMPSCHFLRKSWPRLPSVISRLMPNPGRVVLRGCRPSQNQPMFNSHSLAFPLYLLPCSTASSFPWLTNGGIDQIGTGKVSINMQLFERSCLCSVEKFELSVFDTVRAWEVCVEPSNKIQVKLLVSISRNW